MRYFLTPHQLAEECNTTKRTILFYNEKGILIPKILDDKGFRSYTSAQVANLKLLLLLQVAGIPLNEIKEHLLQTNYSYSKLYTKYSNHIQKATGTLNQFILDINNNFNKVNTSFEKYEIKIFNEVTYYSLESYINFEDSFHILNALGSYFDNFPLTPTSILEFGAEESTTEEQLINIGITKEGRMKPKEKYKHLFKLRTINSQKSLSRTFLMHKNKELSHLYALSNKIRSDKYKAKKALLIIHNREPDQKSYICESNILL
jgi:DNA-binding transcriptional MerR regulator